MHYSLNGRTTMKINFRKVHRCAITPQYKTEGAACADVYAVIDPFDYTYIHPNETQVVQTGLAVEVPDGYELQIRARSGLASKGLMLSNGVGTIDSDYRGEIGIILTNTSSDVIKINTGDRIAQCCLQPVIRIEFNLVDELSNTERGDGGYGSTGS